MILYLRIFFQIFFKFFFSNVPNEHGRSFETFHTSLFFCTLYHKPHLLSLAGLFSNVSKEHGSSFVMFHTCLFPFFFVLFSFFFQMSQMNMVAALRRFIRPCFIVKEKGNFLKLFFFQISQMNMVAALRRFIHPCFLI